MCGIIGYIGKREALPLIIEGLHQMEYRGYDSAGLVVISKDKAKSARAKGKVALLQEKCDPTIFQGALGVGHTRWATHGEPSEKNAHPHSDCNGKIFIVHNGIIENYKELKSKLLKQGHRFKSETDSEVIAHLIEEYNKKEKDFKKAFVRALNDLKGTYGIACVSEDEPNMLLAARMGAPVVIGLGEDENFVASDAAPILRYTRNMIYLNDGEVAVITPTEHSIETLSSKKVDRKSEIIDWDLAKIEKGGYPHFTLKEIMEGPDVIKNTLRGRTIAENGLAKLGGLESVSEKLRDIKRIVIVACGTAFYAGQIGEYMLEEYAGIPTEVETASEFRYRKPLIDKDTALIAISQSGETADTLEAIREAKRKGALTIGIVNTVGSSIARETDAGVYNHAGPEVGVMSTKAFLSQLTVLALISVFLGRQRTLSQTMGKRIIDELNALPKKIEKILGQRKSIEKLTNTYSKFEDFLYIGRKYNFAVAYEGALKLKEGSYIHAEGCGAGEMKHGPIAMIDKDFPTVAIALKDSVYEKMISNIQEIKARKGKVLAIATIGDKEISKLADDVIYIPKTIEILSPILSVIPLQLFAYYMTIKKGLDVDRPRNLAKSVTVE